MQFLDWRLFQVWTASAANPRAFSTCHDLWNRALGLLAMPQVLCRRVIKKCHGTWAQRADKYWLLCAFRQQRQVARRHRDAVRKMFSVDQQSYPFETLRKNKQISFGTIQRMRERIE
jgi:hypothetical protein